MHHRFTRAFERLTLRGFVFLSALASRTVSSLASRTRGLSLRPEAGQTVAEYALVLLVAAAIAGGFLLWARQSGRLDAFFDAIFERLMGSVEPSPTPTPTPSGF